MKTTRRALIEGLAVIVLGVLAVWPLIEIIPRAGVGWALGGFFAAVLWGALAGYLLREGWND